MTLSKEEQQTLLQLARDTVAAVARGDAEPDVPPAGTDGAETFQGAFVTLHKRKMLRGCIGLIEGVGPLRETVVRMAKAASTEDPRFPAVRPEELPEIKIEISVLTPLQRVSNIQEIILGRDGVLIRRGRRSGVFLPQVATETGWDIERFLKELCESKAGLPNRAWEDGTTELYRFSATVFGE